MSKQKIDPRSPFAMFETDPEVEQKGVRIDYGQFYIQVARAGGANTRYRDVFRERIRPHRRALATETLSDDLAEKISLEVFAETVVLGWGHTDEDGNDVEGTIIGRDGKPIEFSVDAVKDLFRALPELYKDVMQQANSFQLFKQTLAELDGKN